MSERTHSLRLFSSVLSGKAPWGTITELTKNWRRTIRFQGGYWLGSFSLMHESKGFLKDFLYTQLGSHVEEWSGAGLTWEGMIYEMDDGEIENGEIFVKVAGYAFPLNWRYIDKTVADNSDTNFDVYITDMLTNYGEFVASMNVRTNATQIRRTARIEQRVWDEILRITSIGDDNGDIWRFYMTNNRRAIYEEFDVTNPKYYARGGIIRRRSLDHMWNHISGQYTDESGELQSITAASQDQSITRYGQKEYKLTEESLESDTMAALRDTFLGENAWPWGRPIGSKPDIVLYTGEGRNVAVSPWQVKPALVRDLSYFVGNEPLGSTLPDVRDFILDEVVVDENRGLSFRTSLYEESEFMEALEIMRYEAERWDERQNEKGKSKHPKSEKRWKQIGVSYAKWQKMSTAQRRRRAKELGVRWW